MKVVYDKSILMPPGAKLSATWCRAFDEFERLAALADERAAQAKEDKSAKEDKPETVEPRKVLKQKKTRNVVSSNARA